MQSNYLCLFIFPIRLCKNELGKHKLAKEKEAVQLFCLKSRNFLSRG